MFSSSERLQKKTPANGIDRKEYINLLVDEYYETTNVGKKFFIVKSNKCCEKNFVHRLENCLFKDYLN